MRRLNERAPMVPTGAAIQNQVKVRRVVYPFVHRPCAASGDARVRHRKAARRQRLLLAVAGAYERQVSGVLSCFNSRR